MATRAANPARATEPTQFLSVDLELEGAAATLEMVAAELSGSLFVLHHEVRGRRARIHYQVISARLATPEATLRSLCRIVERLRSPARRAWQSLRTRDLNVGIQAGRQPHFVEYPITPETLSRVAALGARVVLTVYAPFPRPRIRS